MPSADQVPVKTSHSTMHWHMWVVLIAGSTGSALRAVRSSNLHITPDARRDLVLLFRAAAETVLTIAADPKHLGARIGITAVLHTWGSTMTHHPHVHMIVP